MSNSSSTPVISVLGSGNFGTCLAQHLAQKAYPVTLWGRSQSIADSINQQHRNPRYLSHITLSPRLKATTELSHELLKSTQFLILAIPTQSLRLILQKLAGRLNENVIIICAVKGIENETLKFPFQIIEEILGQSFSVRTAILSGPSFASEVAEQQPTAVAVGCKDPYVCFRVQELFHTSFFRVYTNDDPIGLEVAGALKNVIAVAAGAAAGLGLQQNARAALLTRGLAEITRMGAHLGAKPLTFIGLGGVGDLFLTCTSEKSRNFTVGYRLGKGEQLPEVIKTLGSVAEGVSTTKAAYALTQKLNIDMPIVKAVFHVLYQGHTLSSALHELLNRDMKAEVQLPGRKKKPENE
ncbi:MAG: NAD(P)-dependent glycerol-3-phosphate dehydrogenase [Proteobacteria bacterium]|nr:NAD(P)-dependent glycerol-3-phosphate dehydrogenase [Pseudomonadota bacterium]